MTFWQVEIFLSVVVVGLALGRANASPAIPTSYSLNGIVFYSDVTAEAMLDLDVRALAGALKNPFWESNVIPAGAFLTLFFAFAYVYVHSTYMDMDMCIWGALVYQSLFIFVVWL